MTVFRVTHNRGGAILQSKWQGGNISLSSLQSKLQPSNPTKTCLYFSTRKTRASRRKSLSTTMQKKGRQTKALQPISQIIQSPKLHEKVTTKLASLQKDVQTFVLPEYFQRSRPSSGNALVMDSQWWFWNLFIAAIPTFLLVLVCEHHQEEMREYYIEQKVMEFRKIYGNDYEPSEEELGLKESQNIRKGERILKSIKEILGFISEEEILAELEESSPVQIQTQVASGGYDGSNSQTNTDDHDNHVTENQITTGIPADDAEYNVYIKQLEQRIQLLEEKFENKKSLTKEEKAQRGVGQSPVEQRASDRLRQTLKEKERSRNNESFDQTTIQKAKTKTDEIMSYGREKMISLEKYLSTGQTDSTGANATVSEDSKPEPETSTSSSSSRNESESVFDTKDESVDERGDLNVKTPPPLPKRKWLRINSWIGRKKGDEGKDE